MQSSSRVFTSSAKANVTRSRHFRAPTISARVTGQAKKKAPRLERTAVSDKAVDNLTASPGVLDLWQNAEAVCFDVDCTVTVNDTLDLLAEFMGVGEEVAALTSQAMDGTMNLGESLEERLKIINCKPADIRKFLKAHPPESRLAPGIENLVKVLQARGVKVYLISGGFRVLTVPIAAHLNIPLENVFANRMLWQWDDEAQEPSRLVGFDMSEPTAHQQGKPEAIARIRQRFPYSTVVMVGDGITDLEAVQSTPDQYGADLFIGYGGVVEREQVKAGADWFIYDHNVLAANMQRLKVAMIGAGAWACASMCMVAANVKDDTGGIFEDSVPMWVHESTFEGGKLTDAINELHENPKYLPGTYLGDNVVAIPDLLTAVEGADMLIFCVPHQFVRDICKKLVGKVKPGAMAISLIKGMRVRNDGPQLISQMVQKTLGIDCCVLMGANLASGIANQELSEAVIGYSNPEHARLFKRLFERPYFKINLIPDAAGAEMCGTLKNIVALGAGMVDGLGMGPNTKAAILRQGLHEMQKFSQALWPSIRNDTFLESCGMADLVATCYGGRNRLVAESFTTAVMAGEPKTFDQLEKTLLGGQKLQGVLTSDEVQDIIKMKGWELDYPLFTTINAIVNYKLPPDYILKYEEGAIAADNMLEVPVSVSPVAGKKRLAPYNSLDLMVTEASKTLKSFIGRG